MATVVTEIEGKDVKSQERPQKGRGARPPRRTSLQASQPHTIHLACGNGSMDITLVYLTRLVQCLTSINCDAFAGSDMCLYSWQL